MFTTRPEIKGTFGVIGSTHWLASAAGMAMLERGGNAFDAAVAAGFVLQVVEPHMNGPGGDSALVVMHDDTILVNQNDCRTNDLGQLAAHGPVDLHWLQFSGAIWYPMVYEMPEADMRAQCTAKVASQFARAMRYVEKVDARAVVPSAGPPAFLDDDLFALNMIDGDELSIFPTRPRSSPVSKPPAVMACSTSPARRSR